MEAKAEVLKQPTIRIAKDADTAGIKPENCVDGVEFTIVANDEGYTVTEEERDSKSGGKFTQLTLHLQDAQGAKRELRYLFQRHLAPLARVFDEENPQAWDGKTVVVKGIKRGKFWDVELEA